MNFSVGECQVKRSIVCHFRFQFLLLDIQVVVRFSYDNFQTQMVVERKLIFLSIAELHSSLTITHLSVGVKQRRLFTMSLIHQVSMTAEFIHVVDSLNWKSGKFIITAVQISYSLTDDNYLSLRHCSVISVTRIALPQQILFYTRNVSIYVCLYLFVLFVTLLTSPILAYICTLLNLMVVRKQQSL